jgi:transcriptional regulator with XRE-family HTH domain
MTKAEAVALFGERNKDLAEALGVSASAISQWPPELPQEYADRVRGAALRLGKTVLADAPIDTQKAAA